MIAPDLRGHGRTPRDGGGFTLEGCADDVFGLADALGVSRFLAVGYSMGGPIAQLMWRKQPSRIDGLVLAATSRDFRGAVIDQVWFRTLPLVRAASRLPGCGPVHRAAATAVATWLTSPKDRAWVADELRRGDVRSLVEAASELGRFSSRAWIHEIDVPTSVIVAMADQLVPPRRQLKLARAIEHSVAAFVDADHFLAGVESGAFTDVLVHECRAVARRAVLRLEPSPAYWDMLPT